MHEKKAKLFVFAAPSGAGKTTLVHAVVTKRPELRFSISYTTRKPRKNEADGVDYLFVHALGLILLGGLETAAPKKCHRVAGGLMMAGILLFSGSLFALVLSGVTKLGMITPFGGVSFLLAWLLLAVCYLKKGRHS